MKKFTLLFISLNFIGLTVFSQDKTIIIEHFTSSTCGPCVPGNINLKSLLGVRSDYTIVKYQMNWPSAGDPYYTQEGGDRRNYYGVTGVPNSWIDGQGDIFTPNMTAAQLDAYASAPTFMDLDITVHTYDPSSKAVEVEVDINSIYGNTSTALRLMVAIVENETTGNVGTNGETSFESVFMKFLGGGSSGTLLSVLGPNETVTKSCSGNMTGTFVEEMTDLKAVVWVEDMITKKVWNSAWIDLQDVATVGINEFDAMSELNIYPNPFSSTTTLSFDLEESSNIAINVFDVTGKVVQQIGSSNYSVGNHQVTIDGSNLEGGLYYVNILSDSGVITRKLILDK